MNETSKCYDFGDLREFLEEFRKRKIPVVYFQSEYGPTVLALNYQDVSQEKNKWMESLRVDFTHYWATDKCPEFATSWLEREEGEGFNYWWTFD